MTNKYLEKVALNAFKARSMAKAVGVIPDHTSAWKHAVRNLRDGRGNALQGKALHDARAKLGDVRNNSFQKIKSHVNSNGGSQGYEFGGRLSDGKVQTMQRGHKYGNISKPGDNFHTHPANIPRYSEFRHHLGNALSKPHRLARPSGSEEFSNAPKSLVKDMFNNHLKLQKSEPAQERAMSAYRSAVSEHQAKVRHKMNDALDNGTYEEFKKHDNAILTQIGDRIAAPKIRVHKANLAEENRINSSLANLKATPGADTAVIKDKLHKSNYRSTIVAPDTNAVSVSRMRPGGLRTVYFDHTPRKAK